MKRGRKAPPVETALVQRKVIDAEFDDSRDTTVDALAKQNVALVELMMGNYKDMAMTVKIMSDSFNDSLKAQIESTKREQELIDKKDDRKLKRDKERRNEQLLQGFANDLRALIPVLASKMAKAPLLGSEEGIALRAFIESLSKDQLGAMLSVLSDGQRAAFATVLNAIPDPEAPKKGESNGAS